MKKIKLRKSKLQSDSNYSINYKEELNQSQYEAVMHNTGAALVIAGAGTGKTRTLTYRVARLIEDGISPEKILLLTFTRKSSKEMLDRASKLLDGRCRKVSGGTYHSFALQILKQFHNEVNFTKNFTLMDSSDSEDTIQLVRNEFINSNKKFSKKKRFPNKSVLLKINSASINKQESIEDIIVKDFPAFAEEIVEIEFLIDEYRKYKKRSELMDYDDLLLNLLKVLKSEKASNQIRSRYKYIMIDEYQDTNRLQHEIALLLAGNESNIMAVGDDAQSIYSFRGAEQDNIIFFPKSFGECKIFKIQENYRSSQQILNVTNHIISASKFKFEKELFSNKKNGDLPFIISSKDERQQSQFIVQQILDSREQGLELSDIAILYRSNFLSIDLEIELSKANIPYKKFGGLKFIETAHVKDLLAYLKIVYNFHDIVSWNRVLRLIKNVGPKTVSQITELISKNSLNFNNYEENLSGFRNKDRIFENFAMLRLQKADEKPAIILENITKLYTGYLKENYEDSEKRLKDIEMITQIAGTYNNLENFLNEMSIDPPTGSVEDILPDDNEQEFVTLSTIHSAKGLEWEQVYLIWALDGRFPSSRISNSDELEEERRLFYVASTRAKDNLFITYPINIFDRQTGFVLSKPSRFLEGLDENVVEKYTLVEDDEQ